MGRRRQQLALEEALARALTAGIAEGQRRAFETVLINTAATVLDREYRDVGALVAAEGHEEALRLAGIAAREVWPTRWRDALVGPLSAVMQAATEGSAPVLGSFNLANPVMREYLDGYTSQLAETLSGTSYEKFDAVLREAMDAGLSNPDTTALLRERMPELNRSRAELIARTETHRASIGASDIQARVSGVVKSRTWRATKDARTRPEHAAMDGQTVGMDEPFSNGQMIPGEPNCRCYVEYGIDMEAIRGAA